MFMYIHACQFLFTSGIFKLFQGLQGVQEKWCFFHKSLQPLPRLQRCKRPSKLSTQYECTVSLLLADNFCTTNSSHVLARDSWQTSENSCKKNPHYLMNALYLKFCLHLSKQVWPSGKDCPSVAASFSSTRTPPPPFHISQGQNDLQMPGST